MPIIYIDGKYNFSFNKKNYYYLTKIIGKL